MESKNNKDTIMLTGTLMSYDHLNVRDTVYAKGTMRKAIREFKENKIRYNTAYGSIDKPPHHDVKLKEASHLVRDVRPITLSDKLDIVRRFANKILYTDIKTDCIVEVDLEILDTPYGIALNELLNRNMSISVASRVKINDNDEIEIFSFDLVSQHPMYNI